MAVSDTSTSQIKNEATLWCPLCGVKIGPHASDVSKPLCPSCGFDTAIIEAQKPSSPPSSSPERIPTFAYVVLVIQSGLALLLGLSFLLYASSFYFELAQALALSQLISSFFLTMAGVLLKLNFRISAVRIALLVIGLITLPIGLCALAAGFSLAPKRRYCILCGKQIKWTSTSTDCPHCHMSAHKSGLCWNLRQQRIREAWNREPSITEINNTCPHCFRSIQPTANKGEEP